MDLSVEEFLKGLFTTEALAQPSDEVLPKDEEFKLPPWFDEKKYNQGRRFINDFRFSFLTSTIMGVIYVIAIPSILRVVISTRRSSSVYTSYQRYVATLLHIVTWVQCDLKPGSLSWESLKRTRTSHFRGSQSCKLKGHGFVSQRDMALTIFGFIGIPILSPDLYGIEENEDGDWDAYCHFWAVVVHMIGLEDRYNPCRKTIKETREVCQVMSDRIYKVCLHNPTEYYEHMIRAYLESVALIMVAPVIDVDALLFYAKCLIKVPGYIYSEEDRITLQHDILKIVAANGTPISKGIDSKLLVPEAAVDGLPPNKTKLIYEDDFKTVNSCHLYNKLSFAAKIKLNILSTVFAAQKYKVVRFLSNLYLDFNIMITKYFPFKFMFSYNVKNSFVNMFKNTPVDDTVLKPNSYYDNLNLSKPNLSPWYVELIAMFKSSLIQAEISK